MNKLRFLVFFVLNIIAASCSQRYELAFVSDRSGKADIYVTDSDTSFYTRLYTDDTQKFNPAWTPDGSELLFVVAREGASDLAMAAPDGSGFRYLTRDPDMVAHPDFSPDGKHIVFVSNRHDPNGELYMMRTDGSSIKRLTHNFQTENAPRFSPDSRHILYSLQLPSSPGPNRIPSGAIYLIDTAGYPSRQISLSDAILSMASFSPDGRLVVFQEVRKGIGEIHVLDRDRNIRYGLTEGDPDSRWPVWSPDGKRIAYVRRAGDNSDIWIMRADGSGKRPLVVSPFRDEMPAFRPPHE